jgi:hypothetical protein
MRALMLTLQEPHFPKILRVSPDCFLISPGPYFLAPSRANPVTLGVFGDGSVSRASISYTRAVLSVPSNFPLPHTLGIPSISYLGFFILRDYPCRMLYQTHPFDFRIIIYY